MISRSILLLLACSLASASAAAPFSEYWAYLMKGEERYFPSKSPITDVACFSAAVDGDGHLSGGHLVPPSLSAKGLRYHLVVTIPWNSTLAHIYLDPELPFRKRIVADIAERSKPFDGVQIDFEGIAAEDGTNYLNFLTDVKRALPKGKLFSVAVMARWADHKKRNPTDAFDYPIINRIADRIIVMAYDEHSRTGSPGPIASLPWCREIYDYATSTIAPEKLVMGIPLYGRSWQRETTTQAFRNPEIWTDLKNRNVQPRSDAGNGGSYSYTTNVTIEVHFESLPSLDAKMELYRSKPIKGVAFWRVSQEPTGFWERLME